ncbi:MAG: hypothetical protein LUC21_00365, partial [Oscillospiraceae bacterium]|nr:hypothetical protein [Oscillospiraceae bacterium]
SDGSTSEKERDISPYFAMTSHRKSRYERPPLRDFCLIRQKSGDTASEIICDIAVSASIFTVFYMKFATLSIFVMHLSILRVRTPAQTDRPARGETTDNANRQSVCNFIRIA